MTVIDDLLDFSKLQAGHLALDLRCFDIRDCLRTTVRLLESRASQKGLPVTCDIPASVPTLLFGDPGRLRQVVLNLVSNALNARPAGRRQQGQSDCGVAAEEGSRGVVAGDGREALAALDLAPAPFDLILMDLQMPNLDGFERTAMIRTTERGTAAHVPIIALTANAMQGEEERCVAAGMDGYLAKPFRTTDVFATIERVLHRNGHDVPPVQNHAPD